MGKFFTLIAWVILIPVLLVSNFLTLTSSSANAALSGRLEDAGIITVHSQMQERYREQGEQLAIAQARNEEVGERIQATGTAIRQRTVQSAAANVGSLPAGAVPYLGWAVVVGVTGYELMLACENLRDLNTLYTDFGIEGGTSDESMAFICNPDLRSFADAYERIPDSLASEYAEFQAWAKATETGLPPASEPVE
ncbi:hypothetical protein Q6D67_03975 [Haliea sp. E1-2-M8]|uniref:hypothetical protein n=1 Tax=Haliea sp. E1-2-M8 TaxID=3064706 RepID=UPI00271AC7EC|nr:hypothetical protein [Haliea sp. E1-2-M8]MDO8860852.1 hypothetical protein [Haliea sp. E1-2-M8]